MLTYDYEMKQVVVDDDDDVDYEVMVMAKVDGNRVMLYEVHERIDVEIEEIAWTKIVDVVETEGNEDEVGIENVVDSLPEDLEDEE